MAAKEEKESARRGESTARGRPARLTRDDVLVEALAFVRERHLAELSMRELGKRVGATPMALYRHVGSKPELARLVTDHALHGVRFPRRDAAIGSWMRRLAVDVRKALLTYPGTADLLLEEGPSVPSALRLLDRVVTRLLAEGLSAEEATRLHNTFFSWLAGFVSRESAWRQHVGGEEDALRHFRDLAKGLSPDAYPGLAAALPYLERGDAEAEFQSSLAFMLQGVEAKVLAAGASSPA